MAWTVPSGCYYWYHQFATSTLPDKNVYYSAGQTVPTEYSPNRSYPDNFSLFALVDFTNGVIYAVHAITININNSNKTFTVTKYPSGYLNRVHIICSSKFSEYYPYSDKPIITGDTFVYGDGSGIREKFVNSAVFYDASYAFAGRTDIVTAPTLPNSVDDMRGCYAGCTSLTALPSSFPTNATMIGHCFEGCTSLVSPVMPTIPTAVTSYSELFKNCTALEDAPSIPNNIKYITGCFDGCVSLVTAPTIPSSVIGMSKCFNGCTSLAGSVTINGSPSSYTDAFTGTVNDIVLLGSGGSNTAIALQYANVYAWSLSSSIAAQRDESVLTSVDISVDVTRFNTGTLTSLSLYKNGGQTPLSVTWNDPTLTITGNPTTFTTTITGIAEGDTPTISVIATDAYGSATEVSVNVPIAFYTMDVQAGGKEIAFGAIATDNLTSHPDGLFRCNMDALLAGFTTEIENPYFSLDTTASSGTTDGDLYAAITALSWQSGVIV